MQVIPDVSISLEFGLLQNMTRCQHCFKHNSDTTTHALMISQALTIVAPSMRHYPYTSIKHKRDLR